MGEKTFLTNIVEAMKELEHGRAVDLGEGEIQRGSIQYAAWCEEKVYFLNGLRSGRWKQILILFNKPYAENVNELVYLIYVFFFLV